MVVRTPAVDQRASFLELALRLLTELRRLFDQRLALLRAELAQEATALAKNLGLLVAGAVAASVGIAFLLLALGLWVGQLVGSTSGGLVIVGAGLGAIGVLLALPALRSLQHRRFAQETLRELRRDAEWIRDGV
jgi:hypothetical protein